METLHTLIRSVFKTILNSEITLFFFKHFLNFLELIGYCPWLFTKLFVTTFPGLYSMENLYSSVFIATEIVQSFLLVLLNIFFLIKYSLFYNKNHFNFFYKKFCKLNFFTKIRFILFTINLLMYYFVDLRFLCFQH